MNNFDLNKGQFPVSSDDATEPKTPTKRNGRTSLHPIPDAPDQDGTAVVTTDFDGDYSPAAIPSPDAAILQEQSKIQNLAPKSAHPEDNMQPQMRPVWKRALRVFWRVMAPILLALGVLLLTVIGALKLAMGNTSPAAKQMLVTTLLETGQLKFVVHLFVSADEIQSLVNDNSLAAFHGEVDSSLIVVAPQQENDTNAQTKPVEIEKVAGKTFGATMMIVHDPATVRLATIYPWRDRGDTLDQIVHNAGAIGGINGGLYSSYNNTGGSPQGVVVSKGEIQYCDTSPAGLVLIGLDQKHILQIIDISGMSQGEVTALVQEKQIRDAVSFQEESSDTNNHFVQLVINGQAREMRGMGSGLNPRTAIGQRADGTLLLLVTDGRGAAGHLGASAADLIDVMLRYGAVNAANIDGGSSSCMYYQDEYLMTSVTFYYANASWRLPFAFVVDP